MDDTTDDHDNATAEGSTSSESDPSDNEALCSIDPTLAQVPQSEEAASDNVPGSHPLPMISASDGDEMIQQLKEKYESTTSRSERMTILTLLPRSWSIKKASKVFCVSRYLIRQAKQLVAEKGIMSSPNPRVGRTLPAHVEEEILCFYRSDDISRIMAGRKDFISVAQAEGKRVHKQKRLLLCNLQEAMLCNSLNIECYFSRCNQCPGTEPLNTLLQVAADEREMDTVEFKQWTSTDRASLETKVLPVDDFMDCFIGMLKKLLLHNFTAKMQSSFKKKI